MDLHRTAGRVGADAEADQLLLKARREITEHCLYGVDINPLAVEMAKLSLWLITMDTERPFGFLDDRLAAGDSLLGLVSLEQLESLHVDAKEGRRLHHGTLDFASEWRDKLAQAADLRRKITATGGVTIRDIEHKARLLAQAEKLSGEITTVADAITAAGLANAKLKGKKLDQAFLSLSVSVSNEEGLDLVRREEPPGPAPGRNGRTRTVPLATGVPRDLRRHDQPWLRRHHRQPAVPRWPKDLWHLRRRLPRLAATLGRKRRQGCRRPCNEVPAARRSPPLRNGTARFCHYEDSRGRRTASGWHGPGYPEATDHQERPLTASVAYEERQPADRRVLGESQPTVEGGRLLGRWRRGSRHRPRPRTVWSDQGPPLSISTRTTELLLLVHTF